VTDQERPAAKVIIVEDAAPQRVMLRLLLSKEGYQVVAELATGHALLDAVAQLQPNIICLDHNLPDANGIDLLRSVQASHPAVAVVMITGNTDPALESMAAEAGAAGFIRKPFSQDRIVKELAQVVYAQSLLASAKNTKEPFEVVSARARAVIADDSATMRVLLRMILNKAKIDVVGEAADGKQAVELVVQHKPDFACLDVMMPEMTGLEALEAIRAIDPTARVLMVTAETGRDVVVQAAKAGAKGYIVKPFQPDRVIEAIDKLLG